MMGGEAEKVYSFDEALSALASQSSQDLELFLEGKLFEPNAHERLCDALLNTPRHVTVLRVNANPIGTAAVCAIIEASYKNEIIVQSLTELNVMGTKTEELPEIDYFSFPMKTFNISGNPIKRLPKTLSGDLPFTLIALGVKASSEAPKSPFAIPRLKTESLGVDDGHSDTNSTPGNKRSGRNTATGDKEKQRKKREERKERKKSVFGDQSEENTPTQPRRRESKINIITTHEPDLPDRNSTVSPVPEGADTLEKSPSPSRKSPSAKSSKPKAADRKAPSKTLDEKRPNQYKEGLKSDGYYEGELAENGKRKGQGMYQWYFGMTYRGDWDDNKPHGKGVLRWHGGDLADPNGVRARDGGVVSATYEGAFSHDKVTGKGTYAWSNGIQYNGTFEDNERHGEGTMVWPDGSKFEGQWSKNQIQGFGRKTFVDGSRYEGQWTNGVQEGYGTYRWQGGLYEGTWRNGKMDGRGKMTWFDESGTWTSYYEGGWFQGQKDGEGEYVWCNGTIYKGTFSADFLVGEGVYTSASGESVTSWDAGPLERAKNKPVLPEGLEELSDWSGSEDEATDTETN